MLIMFLTRLIQKDWVFFHFHHFARGWQQLQLWRILTPTISTILMKVSMLSGFSMSSAKCISQRCECVQCCITFILSSFGAVAESLSSPPWECCYTLHIICTQCIISSWYPPYLLCPPPHPVNINT